MHARLPSSTAAHSRWPQSSQWAALVWQPSPSPSPSPPALHPALASPPISLAGGKRKSDQDADSPYSNPSGLDALRKRQRRFRSHSSHSDSDDPDDSPKTPLPNVLDDSMDWAASDPSSSTVLAPIQSASVPPWRVPSPSQAIHRLELLREARPPTITTYTSTFSRSPYSREPPPSKAVPMAMQNTDDEYIFTVELPGYNIDGITVSCKRGNVVTVVADIWHLPRECCHQWDITFDSDVHTSQLRATMDPSSHLLTLTAKRFRRYVPIEYQVQKKPQQSLIAVGNT